MSQMRQAAGLIAALLLFLIGASLLFGNPLIGDGLMVVSGIAAVWQLARLFAARRDPYDLSRLYEREEPSDEPDEGEG